MTVFPVVIPDAFDQQTLDEADGLMFLVQLPQIAVVHVVLVGSTQHTEDAVFLRVPANDGFPALCLHAAALGIAFVRGDFGGRGDGHKQL